MTAEDLARLFHETYERMAPEHGYETRKDSAVPWDSVPDQNKSLMTAVAQHVMYRLDVDRALEANAAKDAEQRLAPEPDLLVSEDRVLTEVVTNVYVRATHREKWGSYDISQLDNESLLRWLRAQDGDNPRAEDLVGVLINGERLHEPWRASALINGPR